MKVVTMSPWFAPQGAEDLWPAGEQAPRLSSKPWGFGQARGIIQQDQCRSGGWKGFSHQKTNGHKKIKRYRICIKSQVEFGILKHIETIEKQICGQASAWGFSPVLPANAPIPECLGCLKLSRIIRCDPPNIKHHTCWAKPRVGECPVFGILNITKKLFVEDFFPQFHSSWLMFN